MQADAYAGFNRLYEASRKPGPIDEAMCWALIWSTFLCGFVVIIGSTRR
jgi:hypothetical protein